MATVCGSSRALMNVYDVAGVKARRGWMLVRCTVIFCINRRHLRKLIITGRQVGESAAGSSMNGPNQKFAPWTRC